MYMISNKTLTRWISFVLVLGFLLTAGISCASCNKKTDPSVPIVVPTSSGSTNPSSTVICPTVTLTPTPLPEYRVGITSLGEEELIYVRSERNTTSRIVGATVNGVDFQILDEGSLWCKILFAEGEEGYVETKYLQIETRKTAPVIHDSYFYIPAKEEMGFVHTRFSGKLKIVPSKYITTEMVPESNAPGAPLIEMEVEKARIDIYSTANVLLASDTTLYLKNAIIRTTPVPSPSGSPTPTPTVGPTLTATPTPTVGPTLTATPTPTPSVDPTPSTTPTESPTPSATPTSEPTSPTSETSETSKDVTRLLYDPSESSSVLPTPTPTPEPVEIVIRNGKITSIKGVVLDEDVDFEIGKDKGHVVTESGEVISYDGMFFEEAEVYITEATYDKNKEKYLIEDGYLYEPRLQKDNLVDVRRYSKDIYIDMLLSHDDNIAGGNVYGQQICLLQRETVEKLLKAQEIFSADGYSIIIYDAYRPYSVTCIMYDIHEDGTYVAGKRFGSIHNRGAAIDISLVDKSTGIPIEMPSPIHTLNSSSNRSNPNMSSTARANMNYMTDVMRECGFGIIASEWWHFTDNNSNNYLRTDHDLTAQYKIIYSS